MKKYFSVLLVAGAISLGSVSLVEAKSLAEKIDTAKEQTQKLNINSANVEQLQSLPGIGLKKAQAIINYRDSNGKFASLEQLTEVKGIGKKMVKKLGSKAVAN